ncbi:MAG: AMP-binding protein [Propionibacteriaceae bacterium]
MRCPLPVALLRHGPTLAALTRALPDRFRLIDATGVLDARTLRAEVEALAARWAAAGLGPGSRLAVLAEGRTVVLGLLAGSLVGADVVAMDPHVSADLARTMIIEAGADAVCRAPDAPPWDEPGPVQMLPLEAAGTAAAPLPGRRGGRALLRSTGTSGHPRTSGRVSYGLSALGPASALIRRLRLWRRDPMVITPPLHHGYGLGFLTLALLTGTPVILAPGTDPDSLVTLLERHRAGLLITAPPTLDRLVHDSARRSAPLRAIVTGSGPLHPRLSAATMDAFGEVLFNLYGTTEGGWCCLATPADLRAAPGTAGRPVPGARIKIINGEVFVASPLATHSQTIFVPTGDLGHLDPQGRLLLDGRLDDLVVVGGVNVDLAVVEDLLRGLPGVRDAVVRATPDPAFGHTLHAEVVPDEPAADTDELRRQLAADLPRAAVPRSWSLVQAVERTPFGAAHRPR